MISLMSQDYCNDDKLVDGPLLVSDVVSIEFGLLIHVKGNLAEITEWNRWGGRALLPTTYLKAPNQYE